MSLRIRALEERDLEALFALASTANFLNLPRDKAQLKRILEHSLASFREELPSEESRYVFVAEDMAQGRLVGTSSIVGQHGTDEEPHIFFSVMTRRKQSQTLHVGFIHQVLNLTFDFNGPTELGALVLLPDYRGKGLGKPLSVSRMLYIRRKRKRFKDNLLCELLPPFAENGDSLLWEELGRKFTNMSYHEADLMSRKNKEFITSLFPEGVIYTCMLSSEARATIGQVGPSTLGVKAILESNGFRYKNMIDPFDGGPHYWAETDQVRAIRECQCLKLAPIEELSLIHI